MRVEIYTYFCCPNEAGRMRSEWICACSRGFWATDTYNINMEYMHFDMAAHTI